MSNSATDYFSFMSSKWDDKNPQQRPRAAAPPTSPVRPSDIIEFVEEPQIEVTESPLSDTMIQRIFKSFSAA